MGSRLELHEIFCDILGCSNAYFLPPSSVRMKYPAIVYARKEIENRFADDLVYLQNNSYEVTVIDREADSEIVKKISLLPKCKFDRHFVSDNLYHDLFVLYF